MLQQIPDYSTMGLGLNTQKYNLQKKSISNSMENCIFWVVDRIHRTIVVKWLLW